MEVSHVSSATHECGGSSGGSSRNVLQSGPDGLCSDFSGFKEGGGGAGFGQARLFFGIPWC